MKKTYQSPELVIVNLDELNELLSECACTNSDDNPWQD
jgi:hypothetical protein